MMLDPQRLNGAGYRPDEIAHAINTLPEGFRNEASEAIVPFEEYWQHRLGPGTGAIIGPSSAGKTTVLCGIGRALGTGDAFFGAPIVSPMGVTHIMGESVGDLPRRYAALRHHTGDNRPWPITWTANKSNLFDQRERQALIRKLKQLDDYYQSEFELPLKVIFFDTVTTNWHFRDENNNAEWALVTKHLEEFADAIDGLALYTHHPPKSGVGERGGGAGRAGLSYILTASCERDDITGKVENRQLALTKHRNGETGPISGFELQQVALGILDAFGQEVTSVVAVPCDAQPNSDNRKPSESEIIFNRAFDEVAIRDGKRHIVSHDGPAVEAVPLKAVREEFFRRHCPGEPDDRQTYKRRHAAFGRARRAAIENHRYAAEQHGGEQWLWRL